MFVSLLYKVARQLLAVPAVLLRRETSKEAKLLVLRHENAVLRRQLQGRVRYEPADRLWLAALSSLIPRRRCTQVFPVAPGTLLNWHRKLTAKNAFDAVFEAEDMEIFKSPPRAPKTNAHCERVISSIRREVLDHTLILSENHARRVLAEVSTALQ
ncbi:hypothetical protein AB0I53_40355 [Saccharopolyspora sp. NPDC050389]|uniref:hypothetical protein n=1 Tax=Saccharopolyspora sp. NPDC050389 TaxID=3155516 RepID=UPI0033DC62CC